MTAYCTFEYLQALQPSHYICSRHVQSTRPDTPLIIFLWEHLNKPRWTERLKSRFRNTEYEMKSKRLVFRMWGCISLGLKRPFTVVNRKYITKPLKVYVLPVKYRLAGLTPLLHETEQVIQEFLPFWVVIYLVQLKQVKQDCC